MTREEKQDLAKEALRYLVQLLPPEQYGENSECAIIERALQTLASEGVSADIRRRFAPGDFVRVHLRNLDGKYWEGTVIKDTGENTVKVLSGKFIEAREVERERIEFAPNENS